MESTPDRIVIYSDGACSGNPGPGGWAWAVSPQGNETGSGGEPHTTNQRMEVMAAFDAVRTFKDDPRSILIVSDSTYVVKCFTDSWWKGWLRRDLWEPFIELVNERGNVEFRWVKGHSGDPMNDYVDSLAVAHTRG